MSAVEQPAPRQALTVGLVAAALPALYTVLTAGLADDLTLRVWRAGGVVPGHMLAEPWRLVTAPLLHLDWAHLTVNGLLLGVLGAAGTMRLGPLRAALVAIFAAWMGCIASTLAAQGWAAGASGAVFGLLGALTVQLLRDKRRGAIWLALLAGSLWWAVPADKAAHLAGLVGGGLLVLLPLSARVSRVALKVAAVAMMAGLVGVAHHVATDADVPDDWATYDGLAVPAAWGEGVPIAPCTRAWTDGLSTLCLAARPPEELPGVETHVLPDGRHLLTHAVSPAARAFRAPLFAAARDRTMKIIAPAPSAGPRD